MPENDILHSDSFDTVSPDHPEDRVSDSSVSECVISTRDPLSLELSSDGDSDGEMSPLTLDISLPIPRTLVSRVFAALRTGCYYVAVFLAVFTMLMTIANFRAYSEMAMSFVSPSRHIHSEVALTSFVADARIDVRSDARSEKTPGEIARERVLARRLETAAASRTSHTLTWYPETASQVASVRHVRHPYSPQNFLQEVETPALNLDITPYDNRIIIPKINKNIPLVDIDPGHGFDFDHLENIFMKELERWVVRYPGTAQPGENGNSFIFGHSSNYPWAPGNYNQVFALLDHLSYGDQIVVYYEQKKYIYTVREKRVVRPGDVQALEGDPDAKKLLLMTCWPVGTTLNRLLVFAELTSSP